MRKRLNFDLHWKFMLGDLSPRTMVEQWGGAKVKGFNFGVPAIDFDDSKWRDITLPHDFILEGNYTKKQGNFSESAQIPAMETIDNRHVAGGSLEGSIGWYRKTFRVDATEANCVLLYFDGIFRNAQIYLNEYDIGNNISGYHSFYIDISDFLNMDGDNVLAVRVDATGREGWWYEGGGIYRHVWLEILDRVHIAPWGVYINAEPKFGEDNTYADVSIETRVNNLTLSRKMIEILHQIKDNEKCLYRDSQTMHIDFWESGTDKISFELEQVQLWDLENPKLYTLETTLKDGDIVLDHIITRFGIRALYFDVESGFYLNKRPVKLKGICAHHDHAGVGIGVPDRVFAYRMNKIKEMGGNAYRCSHNPPTSELLDYCDENGILVIDELRKMGSSKENLQLLQDMVKRDRNHPSIFLWSIGNEEVFAQESVEAGRIARTMTMEVRKLDPSRKTTMAFCCFNGKTIFDSAKTFIPVSKEVDVMGFNYAPSAWEEYHQLMPEQPILITEATANSSTRGCYTTDIVRSQYFMMDPDNTGKGLKKGTAEYQWKLVAQNPYLSGIFLWTGFDYRGEPTPLTYPSIGSHFGIMDYCGFKKDNFYYYKSWWSDEPVLHVFPHWNFIDHIGEPLTVYVYSNLDEVELFVNGESYGKKTLERHSFLEWEKVIYQPGLLLAKGYKHGKVVLEQSVETTDVPYQISIDEYTETLEGNGRDVAIINVSIRDKHGKEVPNADNLLQFLVNGCGVFVGAGNGNPGSHEKDYEPIRRAFNGKCQFLVRSKEEKGEIKIRIKSDQLRSAECRIKTI